jgi:hypothetical protein
MVAEEKAEAKEEEGDGVVVLIDLTLIWLLALQNKWLNTMLPLHP